MKKQFLFTSLFVVLFALIILANPVKAASDTSVYGTVSSLTGSPSITDDDQGNFVITFTKTEINNLKWVKHDDNGIEREKNGWWLGFRVTAPDNADLDTSLFSGGQISNKPFRESLDSADVKYCSFWLLLDENILASHDAPWEAAKYTFYWRNRSDALEPTVRTMTVTVRIDPEGAVLSTTPENPENAGNIIKVTIDGQIFRILKGESLNNLSAAEKTELNKLKTKEGYTFDGFFKTVDEEDVEVKETDPINEDTVLTSKFTKIEEVVPETPAPEEPKADDTTPKTGSSNIELMFLVIAIISAGLLGTIIIKSFINY